VLMKSIIACGVVSVSDSELAVCVGTRLDL
jgi:hypothetical protein